MVQKSLSLCFGLILYQIRLNNPGFMVSPPFVPPQDTKGSLAVSFEILPYHKKIVGKHRFQKRYALDALQAQRNLCFRSSSYHETGINTNKTPACTLPYRGLSYAILCQPAERAQLRGQHRAQRLSYFPHFFLSGIKSMKPHRRMLIMEMISSHRWLERLATLAAPETLLLPE